MKPNNAALDFNTYQNEAQKTDQVTGEGESDLMVPLLGLVGEVGTLAVEHKKRLRDKDKHRLFAERIEEDLGDILWYVANVATKSGFRLEDIARRNLHKVQTRWSLPKGEQLTLFDDERDPSEQIPRHFTVEFRSSKRKRVTLYRNGAKVGDTLTDNNYGDDGYRFHDIFHLAYAAVLGWSPVTRALLGCKRRDPVTDEVEDGGRAIVIEEGIAALAYAHAKTREFLEGVTEVDHAVLDTIRRMAAHLEVDARTEAEWEAAILTGFELWRQLREANGGRVTVDLIKRKLFYSSLPAARPIAKPRVKSADDHESSTSKANERVRAPAKRLTNGEGHGRGKRGSTPRYTASS